MTTIVYDNDSIITDSRVLHHFRNAEVMSECAGKIHYNSHRTIAWASCGDNLAETYRTIIPHLLEVELALAYILRLRLTEPDIKKREVLAKAVGVLNQSAKRVRESSFPFEETIAISRDAAIILQQNQAYTIEPGMLRGVGLYIDAYWLWRKQGLTPVEVFGRLRENAEGTGGHINIVTSDSLVDPDYMEYILQLSKGPGQEFPRLKPQARASEKPTAKSSTPHVRARVQKKGRV